MLLSVITDYELLRQFMIQDEVFSLVSDDGVVRDTYLPRTDGQWLGIFDDFELIGTIFIHSQTSSTVQMHPILLTGHKHKIRLVMRLFFEYMSRIGIDKVNVTVPFIYKNLRNASLKAGFKDEGINRLSYPKHGVLHDQWHMGICRSEWEWVAQ